MCPAAILGDRAAGKTTFVGALYSTMTLTSTKTNENFRFYAPPESLDVLTRIHAKMMTGSFPDANVKDELNKVQFTLGFRTVIGKVLKKSRFAWRGIKFAAYDVSGEDVREYIESGVASTDIIRQLLESYIVVILVDCSRMTLDHDSPQFRRMIGYDGQMAQLISNFVKYKATEFEEQKAAHRLAHRLKIFPAIVLTKTDQLPESLLHKLGLPLTIPEGRKSKERQQFCEFLLSRFFVQTLSLLRGARLADGGPSFDEAAYFTSQIKTRMAEGTEMAAAAPARISIKPASAAGSAQMDASYEEYQAMIDYFGKVAQQASDFEGESEQSVKRV